MHDRHRSLRRYAAVGDALFFVSEIPGVNGICTLDQPKSGIPAFRMGGRIFNALLQFRQIAAQPFPVGGSLVILRSPFHHQIFNIRFYVQPCQIQVVFREEYYVVLGYVRPVHVVHLLDQFIEASVRTLVSQSKIEVASKVMLPVPECLHGVDMVPDPVFIDRDGFPVHEYGMPAALHVVPQPFHHHSQVGVLSGQDAGDSQFDIVVGTIVTAFQVLGRKRMLERNDRSFVDVFGNGAPGVQREGLDFAVSCRTFPSAATRNQQQGSEN